MRNSNGPSKLKSDHIIYVAKNSERTSFSPSKYFSTPKGLLHQKHNRLRTSQLANAKMRLDPLVASRLKKQTLLKYWQIQGRIEKVKEMKALQHSLNHKRKVHSGDRFLVHKKRHPDTGKVVKKRYKWVKERKR